jgi:hypothetical protein
MNDNHSDCCDGLKYPSMSHLHADDCPTRSKDFVGPVMFRESPPERADFDRWRKTFKTTALQQIYSCLDTWGRAQSGRVGDQIVYGSFSQQCFIMANECLKADARIKELEEELAKANKLIDFLPADLVERQRSLLEDGEA